MLYITRKKGESIIINNDIKITIIEVHGNKVKLGCVFPENSTILRSELHDKITEHNINASAELPNLDEFSKIDTK